MGQGTITSPDGKFTVTLEPVKEDTGDFQRFRAILKMKNGKTRVLVKDTVALASISPDSKFVILEPLRFINVYTNEVFELNRDLNIPNYIDLLRWSKDGKTLILSRFNCGMDCGPKEKMEYFKIEYK